MEAVQYKYTQFILINFSSNFNRSILFHVVFTIMVLVHIYFIDFIAYTFIPFAILADVKWSFLYRLFKLCWHFIYIFIYF